MSIWDKLVIAVVFVVIGSLIGSLILSNINESKYEEAFRTTCAQKGGIALEDGHWYCIKPEGIIPN